MTLVVIVIDDDALGDRHAKFQALFKQWAEQLGTEVQPLYYTSFPDIASLPSSDYILWDNDLGCDGETIKHLNDYMHCLSQSLRLCAIDLSKRQCI